MSDHICHDDILQNKSVNLRLDMLIKAFKAALFCDLTN